MTLPSLLASEPTEMGRIVGGWGYVWATYGLTWATFVLYTLSLWLRRPKADGSKGPG